MIVGQSKVDFKCFSYIYIKNVFKYEIFLEQCNGN